MSELAGIHLDDFSTASLDVLEGIVSDNLAAYYYVGRALWEIQHRRLYKDAGYGDFDEYCRAKWGMTDRHAYRLTNGYRVSDQLVTKSLAIPPTESHARELVPLLDRPDALSEAWKDALELNEGKPTAEDVRAIVQGLVDKIEATGPADALALIRKVNDLLRKVLELINDDGATKDWVADDWFAIAKAANEVSRKTGEIKLRAEAEAGQFLAGLKGAGQ